MASEIQQIMVMQKLINKRKEKGLSQEEVASLLGMEQSTYSRKENGHTSIHPDEWEKLAKILDTSIDEIFEPRNGVYIVNNDNASGHYYSKDQHIHYKIPEHVLDTMKKYIEKLEQENKEMKGRLGA